MIGRTISHYEITEKLGEGGMGVVYKATDTKLKRPVALKFLSAHLLSNEEAKTRFFREAQAAAALDHPNICTVYEIDEVEGHTFIAMAHLDGEPLDRKITSGPVPLDDALDIAIQIARGLEAAHRKSIFHRDIKPANVMLLDEGSERLIKIMDFGLAQLSERSKLTELETALGTMAYMSPEQTEAAGTDQRTDLWALGCVTYEMISGQLPFRGDYSQAVQYSILHEAPEPLTGLRTGVPMELEWIVDKCLAKRREDRYPEASALILDLSTLRKKLETARSTVGRTTRPPLPSEMGKRPAAPGTAAGREQAATPPHAATAPPAATSQPSGGQVPAATASPGQALTPTQQSPSEPPGELNHPLVKYHVIEDLASQGDSVAYRAEDTQLKRSVTINVVPESAARSAQKRRRLKDRVLYATVFLLLAAVAVLWLRGPGFRGPRPLRRFALTPSVGVNPGLFQGNAAISPNGRHVAFISPGDESLLWVQDLDRQEPRAIEGTQGAYSPFWSPRSDFIGFHSGGELRKVSVEGGPSVRLCTVPGGSAAGGAWSFDGEVIVFAARGEDGTRGLYEVPARGGVARLLLSPKDVEGAQEGESVLGLPHFLPPEAGRRVLAFFVGNFSGQKIVVQDLETDRQRVLGPGVPAFFSGSGHLVYESALLPPHDLWAIPFSLDTLQAEGEAFPIAENAFQATVAADQTLVYLDSPDPGKGRLVWLDRAGRNPKAVGFTGDALGSPALSPDGRRVAVTATEGANADVWAYDIGRGVRTRISSDPGRDRRPQWSPNGEQIAFSSNRSGNSDVFVRRADGSGEESALLSSPAREVLGDWSRDGDYLLFHSAFDLYYLQRKKDTWEQHRFTETPFAEAVPKLSPNGRYVAYVSNESGQFEVYVQTFPEPGGRVTVSSNGGTKIRWSRDGKELFYVEGETLIAVEVSTEGGFSIGKSTRLFDHPGLRPGGNYAPYDVSADGKRFILVEPITETGEIPKPTIRIVQNWYEQFRERPRLPGPPGRRGPLRR